jgi:hypothetical protein
MHFGQVLHEGVRALYARKDLTTCNAIMRAAWTRGMEAQAVSALLLDGPRHCVVCGGWGGGTTAKGRALMCTCTAPDWAPTYDASKLHLSLWRLYKTLDIYASEWGLCNAYGEALAPSMFDVVWNEGYAESAAESGLPDRAIRMHTDGKLYAMDLKSTGMYVSAAWQRSFEHSQQAAMQLDILEAVLGERVEGFWLDAVHVRRDGMPRKEDLSRYGPLTYSDALRSELRAQRARRAERVRELREHPERALKSLGACQRYGALCPYFDLCRADPSEREALVQIAVARGALEERAWVPSER